MVDTFPRQQARTRRFTLGAPRDLSVASDGSRVAFLRSSGGSDPATALWVLDVARGEERLVAAPGSSAGADVTAEERARRERRREQAAGIVAYSADAALSLAVFEVAGRLWSADLLAGGAAPLGWDGEAAFDPRTDPSGRSLAWCAGGALWVGSPDRGLADARVLAGEEAPGTVSWGMAEFVAAEEMDRDRGFWWAPDGGSLLVARVDVEAVPVWWVADPCHPERPPTAHRYPAAGSADADVSLWHVDLDGRRREVSWDRDRYPYLVSVTWTGAGDPLLAVEQRDHRRVAVLAVDTVTGTTTERAALDDPAWVAWPGGVPTWLDDGRLVWSADLDDTRVLVVDGEPVTPPGLQVRAVHHADAGVVFTASEEPTEVGLWRWPDGGGLTGLDGGGVVLGVAAGADVVAWTRRGLDGPGVTAAVASGGSVCATLASATEVPLVSPRVTIRPVGSRRLRSAVLKPAGHRAGTRLPVLLYPYGGPGAQRVLADHHAWLESQWRADQGFAVVVTDGRGSPGRGPAWERSVHRDLATPVLEDQVDALHAAAADDPDLDLGRVGICGWSFGGYLAALAVLRRPDVFHAAVAGAPVTEWRLYDTYYTERFLGHPGTDPAPYDSCSLLGDAPSLSRPLLVIHGLVDDNVVVAHTLRLSQVLTEHGRPHAVLPLSGITHMASQEEVAEHLLGLQMRFLADALGA